MSANDLFLKFFKEEGRTYLLGVALLIIINLIFLEMPKLIGEAVDTLSHGKEGLSEYILLFVAIMIAVTLLKSISRRMLLGSIRKMEYVFRSNLCNHALAIPVSYYEEHGPGKVMTLMTSDVTSLRVSLGLGVMIVVDAIFFGLCSFYHLVDNVSLPLACIIMSPMPFIIIGVLLVGQTMRKKQRQAQSTYSRLTEFSQEILLGINVIRAFNKEYMGALRFSTINQDNYEKNLEVSFLDALLKPLTFIAPLSCLGISIYVCGTMVIHESMTVGKFVSVNAYIMLMIGPLMGLGSLASVMQKGLASFDRISKFLSIPKEVITGHDKPLLPLDTVRLDNLTFSYGHNTHPALTNVSMEIPAGAFIGIVGGPGSGKTTLFKLLTRIQEPMEGHIFIGNQDIVDIPLAVLRRSIAYVEQEGNVLGTTIRDNIAFGEVGKNHISVEEAARRASLYRDLGERISNHKKGALKERGNNLSGGQKQRVTIARGLYKNAPYVLLDDSFSALDTMSAATIIETLRTTQQQTIIFISQRIEAIRQADMIYVMDAGRIVERGTHQELMNQKGLYYQLYAKQEESEVYHA
ncbi:ABC transporter ATP-binding protein [Veillonella montpellierensis]|uniref:ABC transporter ATP-binding protein n=1 Tax=Veillonella montpellierensis TaxID=187328 RepID=UPI0023F74098|nr:ABC transporter ATP-binding protein [Veillonella montpellierensis]